MSVRYPIALNAEAALSAPLGHAAREREARDLLGDDESRALKFVVEQVGEAFPTREAVLDAFKGRLDDDRKGGKSVAPEDRYCAVREVLAPVKGRAPRVTQVKPAFKDGRRWPKPTGTTLATTWRLSVSYWKIVDAAEAPEGLGPARMARKDQSARDLGREALEALTRQPLAAIQPQRPLDIGLFEVRAPENPGLVLPDE
jgi:hypothetical protein